jgi:hypothetical protein
MAQVVTLAPFPIISSQVSAGETQLRPKGRPRDSAHLRTSLTRYM